MLNYTDIVVQVGGNSYYATQASFNVATPLEPVYSIGYKGPVAVNPNNAIKGTFSMDYHIAGSDGIKDLFDGIVSAGNNAGTSVTLGEQTFTGAFLTSHGAQGQANQLSTAKASFDIYFSSVSQALTFGSTSTSSSSTSSVAFGHGAATSLVGITNGVSFNYEGSLQYQTLFKIGSIMPITPLPFVRGSRKITLEGFNISNTISMCGSNTTASATVAALCNGGSSVQYSVTGQLMSVDGKVSAGDVGKGTVVVNQFI